eukprot:TRINITY_DN110991_c0_g1_i1.p1 TRINITY_DN110991_c0_g1~~TRINITY_DN110991_c0_g1_i1.p1  ORF type:complete len:211 (-),score=39.54 TRINITY_DN110991_c0_g1_i1:36-668(-)
MVTALLLISMVHFIFFQKMHVTMLDLFWMMNPAVWRYYETPFVTGKKTMLMMSVCCVTCMLLKLLVQIVVISISTSLILSDAYAIDAIFDALAITFISDLDSILWSAFEALLSSESIEDNFEPRRLVRCTAGYEWLLPGRGGNRLIDIIRFLVLLLLYGELFIKVLLALDSNVLPAARELCDHWLNHAATPIFVKTSMLFDGMLRFWGLQ